MFGRENHISDKFIQILLIRLTTHKQPVSNIIRCLFLGFVLLVGLIAQDKVLGQIQVNQLRQSIVKITSTAQGVRKTGTGFIVEHGINGTYILTAMHVVSGDKFPQVEFFQAQNTWVEAEVVQNDRRADLSLLKIRNPTQIPANITTLIFASAKLAHDNEELITIGFPSGGGPWAIVRVIISSRQGTEIFLSGPIDEGNSGGPVFRDGKVIGLITERQSGNFSLATPSDIITMVLEGWRIDSNWNGVVGDNNLSTEAVLKPIPLKKPESAETDTSHSSFKSELPKIVVSHLPFEPELVEIPAGQFQRGSHPSSDLGHQPNEAPQREVVFSKPFYLGRTEITVGQFKRFIQETRYRTTAETPSNYSFIFDWFLPFTTKGCYSSDKDGRAVNNPGYNWQNPGFVQDDKHPVVCISWQDIEQYLNWLSEQTGKRYRLPTEDEWEYAARAGTQTPYFYQPDQHCHYANGADQEFKKIVIPASNIADCSDSYAYTAPVASFLQNPFGLFDMPGNVWEWTQSCYWEAYADDWTGYTYPCNNWVVRGGSWNSIPLALRSAFRFGNNSNAASNNLGFRVARDL